MVYNNKVILLLNRRVIEWQEKEKPFYIFLPNYYGVNSESGRIHLDSFRIL